MKNRIDEILKEMKSFKKTLYNKQEVLPELFALQDELVNLTFNDNHAENSNFRIWDVEDHLEKLNENCGYIADELLAQFKSDCKIICNIIKAEKSGQAGENKAFKALETLRCKNTVLKNIEFVVEDHRTELDAIVITEKAVFIVEVKNPGKDICIDERGNYCRIRTDKMVFDKNIGEKMNEKEYLLREALKGCGFENANIRNMVVFTNSAINVENKFPYIHTCYLSEMPHIIGGYDGENIHSDDDIKLMTDAINFNKCHECYAMPIDIENFKITFATLMATLEKASATNDFSEIDDEKNTESETKKIQESVKEDKNKDKKFVSYFLASAAVVTIVSAAVVKMIGKR